MDRDQALQLFQQLNQQRITHLQEQAPVDHRLVLQLLPLLFHLNSKALPGYADDETPAGLIDYTPTAESLDKARQLNKQFHFKRRALRHYPLRGLYLIHTQSWLHYPNKPVFTLWLVCAEHIDVNQRARLENKLQLICDWAHQQGVQLDCRLLSESQVKAKALTDYERDSFYVSGMVLAGALPYWWLMSPDEDEHYAVNVAALQSQRLLNQHSFIDFGAVQGYAATDIIAANQHALLSVLQNGADAIALLFWQQWLQDQTLPSLSARLKQQVYSQPTLAFLYRDQQLLTLSVLTERLPPELLLLAQQSIYLQSHERHSQKVKQAVFDWRREVIHQCVADWGWSEQFISALDQRHTDYAALKAFFIALKPVCKQTLVQLKQFAQQQSLIQDLSPLQALFQARFSAQADSIESLPTRLRPEPSSDRLFLHRFQHRNHWYLHTHLLSAPTEQALFQHENLLTVLASAITNRVLSRSNWLSVTDEQQQLTTTEVVDLTHKLLQSSLQEDDLHIRKNALLPPPTLVQVELFINLRQDPSHRLEQQGLQLSSRQNDPLNFTSFRFNLIRSLDVLYRSNQGGWHSARFVDETAPLELLLSLLQWQPAELFSDKLRCWCSTAIVGQTISQRMQSLMAQLIQFYQTTPQHGRFITQLAGHFYSLHWQRSQIAEFTALTPSDIWTVLADNERGWPQQIDSGLENALLLNTLLDAGAADRISLIWHSSAKVRSCYVVDENDRLIRLDYPANASVSILTHLHHFITHSLPVTVSKRLYQLQEQSTGWQILPIVTPEPLRHFLPAQVEISADEDNAILIIHCGNQRFSGQLSDPAFSTQINRHVLPYKQQNQTQILITRMHFTDAKEHSCTAYLQRKIRLEQWLNE